MLKPQTGSAVRKPTNGVPAAVSRSAAGRGRSTKPSFPSSPVFEGVYNNARMTHFLTAVVGSTCEIQVKNGSVYEGIFKTLSSRCELAVDAVHRRGEEDSSSVPPKREEITETMIFSPVDVITMICRDVDLNFATRDSFTDTAIGLSRVNGEHKEKVLQRWDGGDSNGESYDLDTDTSNGWDANEMFRFNEENYGVKSTYDSSLSMYTVPLERNSSDCFRQREARAARLASEIESSLQYRHRVALENDEGKSEEEKYSAVVRDGGDRESPRERGRDSPSSVNREGKYIPLPQRAREISNTSRGSRGGNSYIPNRSTAPGSSPRLPLVSPGAQLPASSERSSPLSRGGYSPSASSPRLAEPSSVGSPSSSPTPNTHPHAYSTITHSHSLPHALSDASRTINGVSCRMSPKSQRPPQASRAARTSNTHTPPSASRSPKSDVPSQDASIPSSTSMDNIKQKSLGSTPPFTVDGNEILSSAGKEKPVETLPSTEESKNKVSTVQQRSQIEELRKFGNDFRLPYSGGSASPPCVTSAPSLESPSAVQTSSKPTTQPPSPVLESKPNLNQSPQSQNSASASPAEDATKEKETNVHLTDRHSSGTPQPARTPGNEDATSDSGSVEAVTEQVKKSTLNPNAKEFNPNKPQMALSKPSTVPTPPRPTLHSPSVVIQHGQNIYNTSYLSYGSQIHSVQGPVMYHYTMSTVNQGKYPRPPKGSVMAPRTDHSSTAPPMLQAAASAAGASIVASPYGQSYLQYSPQQYSQQQVIQAMTPYGQPMYSVLQSGARMLGQGGGHPQALGPPAGTQFPGQPDGHQGQQQGLYAPQTFSHHSGSVHPPQPSSTPTGNQPPQHTAPSPGQSGQSGPQPQPLYHSGTLSAPTPPTLPPGHSSPQASYPLQGYSLHGHQPMPHTYPALGQLAQAHVPGPMSGPHHSGTHGPPQVVMLHAPPPQAGPGSAPQHPPHGPQQGPPQHFAYLHQVPVQPHPPQQIPFHPPGN